MVTASRLHHAVAQVQVGAADAVVAQQQRRLPEDCQRCIAAQQASLAARRPLLPLLSCLHKTVTIDRMHVTSQVNMVYRLVANDSRGLRDHGVARTVLWTELQDVNLHCSLDWRQCKDIRRRHISRDAAGTLQHMRFILCQQQAGCFRTRV